LDLDRGTSLRGKSADDFTAAADDGRDGNGRDEKKKDIAIISKGDLLDKEFESGINGLEKRGRKRIRRVIQKMRVNGRYGNGKSAISTGG
jgi:hypothetical protein